MKLLYLWLMLLMFQSVAAAENVEKFETFTKANKPGAQYFYSNTYFAKKNGDFKSDFTKCHAHYLEYIKSESHGYMVSKSFGRTDQEIIAKGVKDCLFVNDWKLYIERNGELGEIMFSHLYFKTKKSMSSNEIMQSEQDLVKRKEWYRQNAPNLLK